ncbi:hypothetical protein [Paenibacillus sedimenti]|nr:hypothetical protein [Paenibacillus sedimenti]
MKIETGAAVAAPVFRDLKHFFADGPLKHFLAVAAILCLKSHVQA